MRRASRRTALQGPGQGRWSRGLRCWPPPPCRGRGSVAHGPQSLWSGCGGAKARRLGSSCRSCETSAAASTPGSLPAARGHRRSCSCGRSVASPVVTKRCRRFNAICLPLQGPKSLARHPRFSRTSRHENEFSVPRGPALGLPARPCLMPRGADEAAGPSPHAVSPRALGGEARTWFSHRFHLRFLTQKPLTEGDSLGMKRCSPPRRTPSPGSCPRPTARTSPTALGPPRPSAARTRCCRASPAPRPAGASGPRSWPAWPGRLPCCRSSTSR